MSLVGPKLPLHDIVPNRPLEYLVLPPARPQLAGRRQPGFADFFWQYFYAGLLLATFQE